MLLDVNIGDDSITIPIDNPFRTDIDAIMKKVEYFAFSRNVPLNGIDIAGLIPRMIRGIAGCESGCPANAKNLAEKGFKGFTLKYIEGGILSAEMPIDKERTLSLKMFPEF